MVTHSKQLVVAFLLALAVGVMGSKIAYACSLAFQYELTINCRDGICDQAYLLEPEINNTAVPTLSVTSSDEHSQLVLETAATFHNDLRDLSGVYRLTVLDECYWQPTINCAAHSFDDIQKLDSSFDEAYAQSQQDIENIRADEQRAARRTRISTGLWLIVLPVTLLILSNRGWFTTFVFVATLLTNFVLLVYVRDGFSSCGWLRSATTAALDSVLQLSLFVVCIVLVIRRPIREWLRLNRTDSPVPEDTGY